MALIVVVVVIDNPLTVADHSTGYFIQRINQAVVAIVGTVGVVVITVKRSKPIISTYRAVHKLTTIIKRIKRFT